MGMDKKKNVGFGFQNSTHEYLANHFKLHQMFIPGFLTLLLTILASVEAKKINLYIKPIDSPSKGDSIGFINDDSVYLIDSTTTLQPDQFYCVGTKDLDNHECFTLINGVESLNGTVIDAFMDENGVTISRLSLNFDESYNNKSKLRKHKFTTSPIPNLNPDSLKKQRQKQGNKGGQGNNKQVEIIKQKKLVKYIDDDGNEAEKEIEEEIVVEVDNRSWVQKNWMYIVPPLLLLLIVGGGDQPQQ